MTDQELNVAAQEGNIDHLYTIIQQDPHVLERVDAIPFVDTPLHVAASAGHLQFATEITRLKPSFALKLNQQGLSPIHLALRNGQQRMAFRFADINKDLVRVKGKEGLTPLHFVSQSGELEPLDYFLHACPESIEDVTVRSETALHIAVKYEQYQALERLVRWLKNNCSRGALSLQETVLDWEDEKGNTILHNSASLNDSQALELLIKNGVNLNAKNLENSTALDIARDANAEIRNKLLKAGAKSGSSVIVASTLANCLRSKIISMKKPHIQILRIKGEISEAQRNAYLIVVSLIITATYQTALSPPGGVYQVDAGASDLNPTSPNSTATSTPENAGKSVMSITSFFLLWALNTLSLFVSYVAIYILMPSGLIGLLLFFPMSVFGGCFFFSITFISPYPKMAYLSFLYLFALLLWICLGSLIDLKHGMGKIKTRNRRGGNRW